MSRDQIETEIEVVESFIAGTCDTIQILWDRCFTEMNKCRQFVSQSDLEEWNNLFERLLRLRHLQQEIRSRF